MNDACQPAKESGPQSLCGLLQKPNVVASNCEGLLMALGELVEHFQITWQFRPLYEVVSDESREAGFLLELKGTHEPVDDHVGRRCARCTNLLLALRIIGDWLFRREGMCESCELRACDNFVRENEESRSEPGSVKAFRLASRIGTRCQLGSCPAWCEATLRDRLNRIGSAERGKSVNFKERTV